MNSEFEVLPILKIISVEINLAEDYSVNAIIDNWKYGAEGPQWFWLWVSDSEAILPSIKSFDFNSREISLLISKDEYRENIRPGEVLHWMNPAGQAYHVTMILEGKWNQRYFVPEDAVHFEVNGVHGWKINSGKLPEGAKQTSIQPKGWDHEHCELCDARIGNDGFELGYIDDNEHWICPDCFTKWAKPKSLKFLQA